MISESLGDDIMQQNKSTRDDESPRITFLRATRDNKKHKRGSNIAEKKSKNNQKSQQKAKQ